MIIDSAGSGVTLCLFAHTYQSRVCFLFASFHLFQIVLFQAAFVKFLNLVKFMLSLQLFSIQHCSIHFSNDIIGRLLTRCAHGSSFLFFSFFALYFSCEKSMLPILSERTLCESDAGSSRCQLYIRAHYSVVPLCQIFASQFHFNPCDRKSQAEFNVVQMRVFTYVRETITGSSLSYKAKITINTHSKLGLGWLRMPKGRFDFIFAWVSERTVAMHDSLKRSMSLCTASKNTRSITWI